MLRRSPPLVALLALVALGFQARAGDGTAVAPQDPAPKPGVQPADGADGKKGDGEKDDENGAKKPDAESAPDAAKPGEDAAKADPEKPGDRRALLVGEVLTTTAGVTLVPVPPEPTEGAAPEPVPVPSLGATPSQALVLLFWSRTCPVCKRYVNRYATLAKEFGKQVRFVVVTANADEIPADVAKSLKEAAVALPVFHDPQQATATRLGVRVTPTVLVFSATGALRYRGPLDDDRKAKKSREPVEYLRAALRAVVDGKPVESAEPRPFGSAIRR